ncbi:hypothetical protein QFZ51_006339 [Chitinophaga sp. W3I9]|uniref:nucleotidyl transferase AbiEii/AbiGii toxin family protein n=1 Tax=Chitinophaga sp. W3I9 TaxID=3373924 RepID=UPI003D197BDA
MSLSPIEQRLNRMESDIQQIKGMLSELLDLSKGAFQSHAHENIMSAKEVADLLRLDVNVIYDLDFSIDGDFDSELEDCKNRIENVLKQTFLEHGYILFDYNFMNKPKKARQEVSDFWGGYKIEFKLIPQNLYDKFNGDIEQFRKLALPLQTNNSPKFEIEISKYEYVEHKMQIELDGYVVYVYTPEMIVFEKVRAICQQLPEYAEIIPSHSPRPRARDFYDIHLIMSDHKIDPHSNENKELIKNIFEAKRVPLNFIKLIRNYKVIHNDDWKSVEATVSAKVTLEPFDYYFDFVLQSFETITFP